MILDYFLHCSVLISCDMKPILFKYVWEIHYFRKANFVGECISIQYNKQDGNKQINKNTGKNTEKMFHLFDFSGKS